MEGSRRSRRGQVGADVFLAVENEGGEATAGGATVDASAIDALVRSITAEFGLVMPRPERVAADCHRLGQLLSEPPTVLEVARLGALVPLLSAKGGRVAAPLF